MELKLSPCHFTDQSEFVQSNLILGLILLNLDKQFNSLVSKYGLPFCIAITVLLLALESFLISVYEVVL